MKSDKIIIETKVSKQRKLQLLLLLLPAPLVASLTAYLLGATSTTIIAVSALGLVLIIAPFILHK